MGSAIPGPDILYITRTTLDRGLWAGRIRAAGVLFASLFYLGIYFVRDISVTG